MSDSTEYPCTACRCPPATSAPFALHNSFQIRRVSFDKFSKDPATCIDMESLDLAPAGPGQLDPPATQRSGGPKRLCQQRQRIVRCAGYKQDHKKQQQESRRKNALSILTKSGNILSPWSLLPANANRSTNCWWQPGASLRGISPQRALPVRGHTPHFLGQNHKQDIISNPLHPNRHTETTLL